MERVVSFAAVIRVDTRHATLLPTVRGEERCVTSDDPYNGCEGDYGKGKAPQNRPAASAFHIFLLIS